MDCTCKCKDIIIFAGDVLEVYFDLPGIDTQAVKTLWFSSKDAGLCVECPFSEFRNAYCLRLASDVTSMILPRIASYDLTAEFIDGNQITVVSEGMFVILKRRNEMTEEEI